MSIKLGKFWLITTWNDEAVCAKCGSLLDNLNIKANETGTFYCSESCCIEDVKQKAPEGGY